MYAWRHHDGQTALEACVDEDIAREERQKKQLGSIRPPTGGRIQREQGFESLAVENLRHRFLMLVARIKRVASARRIQVIS